MRICLYTDSALPKIGGQEGVVDALARTMQRQGHDIVVLAPRPRLPLWPRDNELPYPVVRHPRFYSTRYFVSWYRWFLSRLHRRHRTELLHCHAIYPPGYLAALTKSQRGVPTVLTTHTDQFAQDNLRLTRRPAIRERVFQAVREADALVAISRDIADNYRKLKPDAHIVNIPNGVDLELYARPVARPSRLPDELRPGEFALFLGRLSKRKGVDVLLNAIVHSSPTTRLVIAGDGDERAGLERQAEQLGLRRRVWFVGAVQHPIKTWLVQNSRFAVAPSRGWEAFPLIVLECYAAGKPIIASSVAGLRDLVRPGETGWLVPEESPGELAHAWKEAWRSPAEVWRRGDNALRFAQDRSWDAVALRHVELYEELLGMRSRPVVRLASGLHTALSRG